MSRKEGTISSLRELPRDIPPARDLWPAIQARLTEESRAPTAADTRVRNRHLRMRFIAAAAMIAMLAVGIWIGRSGLPLVGQRARPVLTASTANPGTEQGAVQTAYTMDPKYLRDRAELVKSLEGQLATLPPQTRTKVMASLATIQKSKQDLEAALGHDPSNALLQELLVNTYQDEMRVLTAVQEAGTAGKGI
ncbi:MAG TPA: hypothetical protein VGL55_14380 [Steroidobacteraceae bacterium]|jgi:hypothetical protein